MAAAGKNGGFTLVEIVVVIVILGLLAAFAIPRLAALEGQARAAATEALGGSVRARAALAHALWRAAGEPGAIGMDGATVTMVLGYPNRATIDDALVSTDGFLYDAESGVFSKTDDGVTGTAGCSVTYTGSVAAGSAPRVAVDTSGC